MTKIRPLTDPRGEVSRVRWPRTPISETEALDYVRNVTKDDASTRSPYGSFTVSFEPPGIATRLYLDYMDTNYVYGTMLYPGIARLEREVVSMMADYLGLSTATGDVVSGGTEANILGEECARNKGGNTRPNIVMPVTAHPCCVKGCELLHIECRRTGVDKKTWRADVKMMEEAIDDNTVAIWGTAGEHMHGAIDDIPAMSKLAKKHGINLHVDAAWGGFITPFLKRQGLIDAPDWDFRLEGVSTITIDPHKLALSPLPAGGIMFRDESLREHTIFNLVDEYHGTYTTSGLLGSRSGAPIVCTHAIMRTIADEGYLKYSRKCFELTKELVKQVRDNTGIQPVIEPNMNLVAFAPDLKMSQLSRLVDEMEKKGWKGLWATPTPPSFRCVLFAHMESKIPRFVADLKQAYNEVRKT